MIHSIFEEASLLPIDLLPTFLKTKNQHIPSLKYADLSFYGVSITANVYGE